MTIRYFIYRANQNYAYMISDLNLLLDLKKTGVKEVESGVLLEDPFDSASYDKKARIIHDVIKEANQNSNFNPKLLEERLNELSWQNL